MAPLGGGTAIRRHTPVVSSIDRRFQGNTLLPRFGRCDHSAFDLDIILVLLVQFRRVCQNAKSG